MTKDEIEAVLRRELNQIAPDIDISTIERDGELREEFDIDSMDFLNLVTALARNFGIEMPEADYPQMASFNAMLAYLEKHAG